MFLVTEYCLYVSSLVVWTMGYAVVLVRISICFHASQVPSLDSRCAFTFIFVCR